MIYIDSDFKCHTTNPDGAYREVEHDFFSDKCDTFIEGYRFIPVGESWTREDGVEIVGEMIAPWKDDNELIPAQLEYEQKKLADAENALAILLGGESV